LWSPAENGRGYAPRVPEMIARDGMLMHTTIDSSHHWGLSEGRHQLEVPVRVLLHYDDLAILEIPNAIKFLDRPIVVPENATNT